MKKKSEVVELICEVMQDLDKKDHKVSFQSHGFLPRTHNQSIDGAHREWLQKHGEAGSTYQVIILKGERLTVHEPTLKTFVSQSEPEVLKEVEAAS